MGSFSLSALDESAYSLLTPEYTLQTSSGTMSSTNPDDVARGIAPDVRQYSKIRDVLGDAAPAPSLYDHQLQQTSTVEDNEDVSHGQHLHAHWHRNKLTNMLGGLPTNITTPYATDSRVPLLSSEAPSDVDDRNTAKGLLGCHSVKGQQRLRAKKLRHFFGQSLNSDAMLMQGISKQPAHLPESLSLPVVLSDSDQSFELVEQPSPPPLRSSGKWQLPPVSQSPVPDTILGSSPYQFITPNDIAGNGDDGLTSPAQFWMTSSPKSQESVVDADEKS
ncbi:hypothetical protein H4R20_005406, partial [Coemansia guatemalensis]